MVFNPNNIRQNLMWKQKYNNPTFKSIAKTIGIILILISCIGLFYFSSDLSDYIDYKHLEYDKIISIDYKFLHELDNNNSEYWTTGCVYTLQAKDLHLLPYNYHRTKIQVCDNHKFLTKNESLATLYCAGEENINKTISLYYPTKGHIFNIETSYGGETKNNKCYFKETSFKKNHKILFHNVSSRIIFDPCIVYGINSKIYYEKYIIDKQKHNIIIILIKFFVGLFTLFFGFLLTQIEEWCFTKSGK